MCIIKNYIHLPDLYYKITQHTPTNTRRTDRKYRPDVCTFAPRTELEIIPLECIKIATTNHRSENYVTLVKV